MRAFLRATLLAAAFCGGGFFVGSSQARPIAAIKAAGVLRVTVYRDYKPWSWKTDKGVLKGIDVDIGAALAKSLGVKVDYMFLRADDNLNDDLRNGVWKGTLLGQAPGDVMLHIPDDPRVEFQNDLIKLTGPYYLEGYAMAVDPADAAQAKDFSLFEKKKVAVDIGTLADLILLSERNHTLINNIVHVRGEQKAAEAYDKGEVAAFYGEAALVENLASHAKRPVTIVYPKTRLARNFPIGGAVKVDSFDLALAITQEFKTLAASGELKKIFASYGVVWRPPPQQN